MKAVASMALCLALSLAAGPLFAQSNKITYKKNVALNVGQSVVIHGVRGECGQAPVKSAISLPALKTGKLSLGNDGFRDSGSCGGRTPAVEVIFTATAPGREAFEVEGDPISVRVK